MKEEPEEIRLPEDYAYPPAQPLPGMALRFETPVDTADWLKWQPIAARERLNQPEELPEGGLRFKKYGGISEWVEFAQSGEQRIRVMARGMPSKGGYPLMQLDVRDLAGEPIYQKKFKVFDTALAPHEIRFQAPAGAAEVGVYFLKGVFVEGQGAELELGEIALENARLLDSKPTEPGIKALTDPLIRQHRMGQLTVQAPPNAQVEVELVKHAFLFGANIEQKVLREDKTSKADRQRYLDTILTYFNSVTPATLYWFFTEKEFEEKKFELTDAIFAWAKEHDLFLKAHCTFWGSDVDSRINDWQKEMEDDDLRKVLRRRGHEVTSRYKGLVDRYDINNEMLHHRYFRNRLGDATFDMVSSMLAGDPDAKLTLNEFNVLNNSELDRYIDLANSLLEQGVPLAGLGLQGRVDGSLRLEHAWDALDRLAAFDLPVYITEATFEIGTDIERAESLDRYFRMMFAHPAVDGITLWGFWEEQMWIPEAALWDKDWNRLPPGDALHQLLKEEWHTHWQGQADANGLVTLDAFYGQYRVTINGESQQIDFAPANAILSKNPTPDE